jgi:hypothetical protein
MQHLENKVGFNGCEPAVIGFTFVVTAVPKTQHGTETVNILIRHYAGLVHRTKRNIGVSLGEGFVVSLWLMAGASEM